MSRNQDLTVASCYNYSRLPWSPDSSKLSSSGFPVLIDKRLLWVVRLHKRYHFLVLVGEPLLSVIDYLNRLNRLSLDVDFAKSSVLISTGELVLLIAKVFQSSILVCVDPSLVGYDGLGFNCGMMTSGYE